MRYPIMTLAIALTCVACAEDEAPLEPQDSDTASSSSSTSSGVGGGGGAGGEETGGGGIFVGGGGEGGVGGAGGSEVPTVDVALTQSLSTTIDPGHSVVCKPDGQEVHHQSSYYRVFDLTDVGGSLDVTSVTFAVQQAIAQNGTQTMEVRLHTLDGDLALANLNPLAAATVTLPEQSLVAVDVPIEAALAPGDQLVVELFVPEGVAANNFLRVGMNDDGETAPTYISAPQDYCGTPNITPMSGIGLGNRHLILTVNGEVTPQLE